MPLFMLLLLFLTLAPAGAMAGEAPANEGDAWFAVEVVVFARPAGADDEHWPMDPGTPDLAGSLELAPAGTSPMPPMPFATLPTSQMRLVDAERRLAGADGIEVLTHMAWQQPAIASEFAPPVHILIPSRDSIPVPSEQADPAVQGAEDLSQTTASETTDDMTAQTMRVDTEPAIIDGWFRLSMNRYLHADIDLLYAPPPARREPGASDTAGTGGPEPADVAASDSDLSLVDTAIGSGPYYRLHQSRRIKADELHYFDHPRLGVLVFVSRLPPPATEPQEAAGPVDRRTTHIDPDDKAS